MTKKERVIAAIEKRETEGIPSSFSLHFPQDKKTGEACVKAHLNFFKETDTDICKIMNENLIPVFGRIHSPEDYDRSVSYTHLDVYKRQATTIAAAERIGIY